MVVCDGCGGAGREVVFLSSEGWRSAGIPRSGGDGEAGNLPHEPCAPQTAQKARKVAGCPVCDPAACPSGEVAHHPTQCARVSTCNGEAAASLAESTSCRRPCRRARLGHMLYSSTKRVTRGATRQRAKACWEGGTCCVIRMRCQTLLRRTSDAAVAVLRVVGVYTVVMGLGGYIVWPAMAPVLGEAIWGEANLSFEHLHARLFPARTQ